MQLDARLAAIAAFVPHGTAVADIGGDHAYLAATLVLQPMNGGAKLRRWLYANGWNIVDEALARAGGRLYEIIRAEHGTAAMPDDALLHIGACLFEKRDPLIREHIEAKAAKLTRAAEGMNASTTARQSEEYRETVSLLTALRTLLVLCRASQPKPPRP